MFAIASARSAPMVMALGSLDRPAGVGVEGAGAVEEAGAGAAGVDVGAFGAGVAGGAAVEDSAAVGATAGAGLGCDVNQV